jgi:protein-L-isoaspartate(D-aspartate) O-methyltransferase
MSTPFIADSPADQRRRQRMVRDQLAACPDAAVRAAMAELPRHAFLPAGLRAGAYDDCARAIGAGQTISQPRLIAAMLTSLAVGPGKRVLDVGAGSGYTAALLARLAAPTAVLAIERQGDLIEATRERLAYFAPSVELRHGDGLALSEGTFDVIHVAAACTTRPEGLIARLNSGGRLVAPIGPPAGPQRLLLVAAGRDTWLDDVLFVPGLPGIA